MSNEFTPITTQEEFDEKIKERLEQKEASVSKKFEGYLSAAEVDKLKTDYEKQISGLSQSIEKYEKGKAEYEKTLAEKDAAIKGYESHSVKTQIANELGLPYEAIDFIKGEEEEDIRKSAEALKTLTKPGRAATPLANPDPETKIDNKKLALKETLNQLKGE